MGLKDGLIAELKYESGNTKKALERLPEEHVDWKPHEKSYSLKELTTHIARMHSWLPIILSTEKMDVASPENSKLPALNTKAEIMLQLDKNLEWGLDELDKTTAEKLEEPWTLHAKEHVIFTLPKKIAIRTMVYNHIIHHRGQLMVYYRLLGVPVPGLYGPSADEQ